MIEFVSWKAGGMDAAQLALLKSSLRVEHLQENMFEPPSVKSDDKHTKDSLELPVKSDDDSALGAHRLWRDDRLPVQSRRSNRFF